MTQNSVLFGIYITYIQLLGQTVFTDLTVKLSWKRCPCTHHETMQGEWRYSSTQS